MSKSYSRSMEVVAFSFILLTAWVTFSTSAFAGTSANESVSVGSMRHTGMIDQYAAFEGTLMCAQTGGGTCSVSLKNGSTLEIESAPRGLREAYSKGRRSFALEARVSDERIVDIRSFRSL